MEYGEDELLNLSGIQHFAFCRRQWALIEIEQQWSENLRTVEGTLMHERAHDPFVMEKRGDVLVSRAMPVSSRTLGVSGVCDVVEFHADPDGVTLFGREGRWKPEVVEYKRGEPKAGDEDRLQLCCQAMCLEEMLACPIPGGAIYYGQTARRTRVEFDSGLRGEVKKLLEEMHALYRRRYTPKAKPSKSCNACSLKDLCLPQLARKGSASEYIQSHVREEEL